MSTKASELNARQNYYDLLHHQMRAAELSQQTKLDWLDRELLRESNAIIADPLLPKRSVDLSEHAYLRELDAFAFSRQVAKAA